MAGFFFADECDGVEIECPCCDGGTVETGPYGYDRRNGEPIFDSHTCRECDGTGSLVVPSEPIILADLLELDAEMAAAIS